MRTPNYKTIGLLLGAILILTSNAAEARERAYRIFPEATTLSGFAIGWGMKGKNLDFEALDKLADPSRFFAENEDSLANYLVDLENEQIIETVSEPAVLGRLGGVLIPNYHKNKLELKEVPLNAASGAETAVVLVDQFKWHNEIRKLLIVDREPSGSVIVFESLSFGQDLVRAILAKLKPALLKKYLDYNGAVTWQLRSGAGTAYGQSLVVEAEVVHPRQDDPSLLLAAEVDVLRTVGPSIQIVVNSASLKQGR